jgi:hypothetical protein
MNYNKDNTLVCISNTKDACLYFDDVIPLNLGEIIPWRGNEDASALDILYNILPPTLLNPSAPEGLHPFVSRYLQIYADIFPESIGFNTSIDKEYFEKRSRLLFPLLVEQKDNITNLLSEPINEVFGANDFGSIESQNADPALILTGLNLIDTSKIQWKHILELRGDKESIKRLRRLRTFVFENYQDKPLAYINDDILNRIDIYESTAKKWGLKTKDSIFKIIFSSGTAIATTAATIASVYTGTPLSISLPLSVASTFLIGNIGLEIRTHKRDLSQFKHQDPITYLIDTKEKLN